VRAGKVGRVVNLMTLHAPESGELVKRKRDYLSSPSYILEHYNIERQNIQAHNGRQLLEMLQNAGDASENAKEKKVLIKLNGNHLIIANNGEPFNEDEVRPNTRTFEQMKAAGSFYLIGNKKCA
jgi:hypothetical protein